MHSRLLITLTVAFLCLNSSFAAESNPIGISVDTSEAAVPYRPEMLGANNEMLGDRIRYNDPDFERFWTEAGKPMLRFPGGTGSNFYDWETGRRILLPTATEEARKRHSGGYNPGLFKDFLSFLKRTDARFIIPLNILAMEPERNARQMQRFKDAGIEVTHVEMGNEVYFGTYAWAIQDVHKYLEVARKHTEAVRSVFPGIKVGLVIPSHAYTEEVFLESNKSSSAKRMNAWYDVIEQESKRKDAFFDAVILHLYGNNSMDGKTSKEDFVTYKEAYHSCQAHAEKVFGKVMNMTRKKYPSKELWITEWHVGGFSGALRQYRLRYSYLGALYAANFQLKLLLEPNATVSGWHAFIQWADFRNPNQELVYKNNFYFYQAIASALDDAKSMRGISFSGSKTTPGTTDFPVTLDDLEGLLVDGSKGRRLILVNRFNRPYTINKIQIDGESAGIRSGMALTPDPKLRGDKALNDEERHARVSLVKNGECHLPPYSLIVIELN